MALLMGGSLVLIAASAGILVVGWLNANPSMIVASMAGLVTAGLLLVVAFIRGRRIIARSSGAVVTTGYEAPVEAEPVARVPVDPVVAPLPLPGAASVSAPIEEPEPAAPAATPKPRKTRKTRKPATTAATSTTMKPKATAKKTTAKQPPKVVVFDGRDKYHRPECRFAKGRGAEKVTKATARRWGYEPCSICQP